LGFGFKFRTQTKVEKRIKTIASRAVGNNNQVAAIGQAGPNEAEAGITQKEGRRERGTADELMARLQKVENGPCNLLPG